MMIDKYKISEELDYLLASYLFRNKPQIQRLLTYLVKHADDRGESAYDQRAIAIECLGRDNEFDPAENPVVRIEIGRLRKLLNHFYSEDSSRKIIISIPLGQYRPSVSLQAEQESEKSIPELFVSPAKPESLSLLLQFETDGEDCSDLYLLRHQVRIGLTVHIGKLKGVRLVVALPDEEGNISSHIDFIMRVSIGHTSSGYQLVYSVIPKASAAVLFEEKIGLSKNYDNQDLNTLIGLWGTDLLDQEVGLLWVEWVRLRTQLAKAHTPRVRALVNFQQYLLKDSDSHLEEAFLAVRSVQREDSSDNTINAALSELYYRIIINGSDLVPNPVTDGLQLVRESLRTNPACSRLHLILAFMMFFSKEHHMAEIELNMCREKPLNTFSFKFHLLFLSCLMSGLEDGLDELGELCDRVGVYPQPYIVMLYLRDMLLENEEGAATQLSRFNGESSLPMIKQCLSHMVLPSAWVFEHGRDVLTDNVLKHLSQAPR